MTEPTDRERVAWELCETQWSSRCPESTPCSDCLRLADRAMALGATPPVEPVEELIAEMRVWLSRHDIFRNRNCEWLPGECMAGDIVRHVLARAKELGL